MIQIQAFTFNPFDENTYILYDDTKECVIIDPGCSNNSEQKELVQFIADEGLKPVKLLNTHCHIDHVFGNAFIAKKYNLGLEIHKDDLQTLHSLPQVSHIYGLNAEESVDPSNFLKEGDQIKFGNSVLDIVFTPGHSPGSICFISHADKFIIGGDVLFYGSIGRTDLPGGDHAMLLSCIRKKLFILGDDYAVFSGHGQKTSIGFEKKHNPFLVQPVK
ncbi:MAG: MBL fold metallo-hydrolase [Bacteroidetes bacterium]|nr:MAG: MBL fold metallo-hydrolase [Bacteroidota bacterium]